MTEEQINFYFEQAVHQFIKFFGLKAWKVEFKDYKEFNSDTRAYVEIVRSARIASFSINKAEPLDTAIKIRELAFHEVLEVLLSGLSEGHDESGEKSHEVIRTFENTIFRLVHDALWDKCDIPK